MIYTQKQGTTQMRQLQQKQPFHFTFHFNLACISVNMSKYNIFIVLSVCVVFFVLLHSFVVLTTQFLGWRGEKWEVHVFSTYKIERKIVTMLAISVACVSYSATSLRTENYQQWYRTAGENVCVFFSFFLVFFFIVLSVSMSFFLLRNCCVRLHTNTRNPSSARK